MTAESEPTASLFNMDEGDWWRSVEERSDRIEGHPGRLAVNRWNGLNRSYLVYARNVQELRQLLHEAENDVELGLKLMADIEPNEVRDEFFSQLDQRLHNMVAGVVSLIDHSRRLTSTYEGEPFHSEFASRNEDIRVAPVSTFIRRLRNYLLHRSHAPFMQTMTIGSEFSHQVLLSKAALLDSGEFTGTARAFIEQADDGIRLSAAVEKYVRMMESHYRWVFDQFEELHGDELRESNDMVNEYNARLGR